MPEVVLVAVVERDQDRLRGKRGVGGVVRDHVVERDDVVAKAGEGSHLLVEQRRRHGDRVVPRVVHLVVHEHPEGELGLVFRGVRIVTSPRER